MIPLKSNVRSAVSTVAGWLEPFTHLTRMWMIGSIIAGVSIAPFDLVFSGAFVLVGILFGISMCACLLGDKCARALDLA